MYICIQYIRIIQKTEYIVNTNYGLIYTHACTHIHTHTPHTHAHTLTQMHTYTHTHTHSHTYTHTHTRMHADTHTYHMHAHTQNTQRYILLTIGNFCIFVVTISTDIRLLVGCSLLEAIMVK